MTLFTILKFTIYLCCISLHLFGNVAAENEVCNDGTTCQNGSTCIPLEKGVTAPATKSNNGKRSNRCDCTKVTSLTRFYAGYECEYPSDDICLLDSSASTGISFCVNGGDCKHKYIPDDNETPRHDGCDCKEGFEGDYCEYIVGQAPKVKLHNSGLMIGLIATFATLSLISGIFIIRKLKKKSPPKVENTVDRHVKAHETEMT